MGGGRDWALWGYGLGCPLRCGVGFGVGLGGFWGQGERGWREGAAPTGMGACHLRTGGWCRCRRRRRCRCRCGAGRGRGLHRGRGRVALGGRCGRQGRCRYRGRGLGGGAVFTSTARPVATLPLVTEAGRGADSVLNADEAPAKLEAHRASAPSALTASALDRKSVV